MNYFILIRTIYNQAIASDIVDKNHYPFGKGKITIKFPESLKLGLSTDEVKRIEGLDLSGDPSLHHARNIWLFSFYFAGIRAGDVLGLRWLDFKDGRLQYSMNKNEKVDSLKLSDKALNILNEYKDRGTKHDLVFPELTIVSDFGDLYEVQRKTSYAVKRIDKALKNIAVKAEVSKPLTMHISRHTFGNISGDKIPIQMLRRLYRHSSITTTIGYQANFIHKDTDEALNAVISF